MTGWSPGGPDLANRIRLHRPEVDVEEPVVVPRVPEREEAVHDKELAGADGKSLAQNLGIALKAAEELGGKELADALKASPFGSFPPLLRALYRAGSRMGDDNKIVDGRVAALAKAARDGGLSF